MNGPFEGFDRIVLTGVRAFGYHGILAQEQRDGQEFVVDIVMHADVREAGRTDELDRTVDYSVVADDIVACVEGERLDLIEALAQRIADRILQHDRVSMVDVTVHKPHAPVPHPFQDVSVTITRVG